jgi:hypothetical protein
MPTRLKKPCRKYKKAEIKIKNVTPLQWFFAPYAITIGAAAFAKLPYMVLQNYSG